VFFPAPTKPSRNAVNKNDIAILHKLQCEACPLNHNSPARHPHMPATGVDDPLIYCLGEAPGANEDQENKQFIGESGEMLRGFIKQFFHEYTDQIRWNNVVRTWPGHGNPTPTWHAIECCRPSVIRDIEESRPKAIFGFGNVPLNWVTTYSGINAWRGRVMPVKIGTHTCWFFSFMHPAAILHQLSQTQGRKRRGFVLGTGRFMPRNEDERMLQHDLRNAFELLNKLPSPIVHDAKFALSGIQLCPKPGEGGLRWVREKLAEMKRKIIVGIDYETNTLRPYGEDSLILTAAISDGVDTISIPFDHPGSEWSPKEREKLGRLWRDFLETCEAVKAVHNLQFEMEWTGFKFGRDLLRKGRWACTQVQASLIDERYLGTQPGPLSLEFLVLQHFGINIKQLANVDRSKLMQTPLPNVLEYNGLDSRYHALLYRRQFSIIKQQGLDDAYKRGVRRVPTLVLAQMDGVPVSQREVERLYNHYDAEIIKINAKIQAHRRVDKFKKKYGGEFNPLGPDVIKLFAHMEHRYECVVPDKAFKKEQGRRPRDLSEDDKQRMVKDWDRLTPEGKQGHKLSADEDVLESLEDDLADLIVQARKATKMQSTYVVPLMKGSPFLWPGSLLHVNFNHTLTTTGRLSCDEVNLQNFPKRQDLLKEVRASIRARKGRVILAIDYGQIEARVIAMATRDKRFVAALWEGYDIHQEWAERIAHAYPARIGGRKFLTDKKVMKDLRTDIKNQWTFPLVFGATVESASSYLKIPLDKLKPLYDEFWRQFSGIKKWQDKLLKQYHERGYVETFTGRRRRGPLSTNMVYNAPIQSFTCELIMEGMSRLSETGDPLLQPQIQIHDDLTWTNVPEDKVDYVAEKALEILLYPPFEQINVPITLEMSVGPNWRDMEDIGVFASNEWGK
jgi:uracil-DNA glycosylase family 4